MEVVEEFESGWLHKPDRPTGNALVLTHGAGSSVDAPLLKALSKAFAASGVLVYRYTLPFRLARPRGSPYPAGAAKDRAGVEAAIESVRSLASGRIVAGGHSYGGRQTSMLAAEKPAAADALLLLSYPLHAPGKPDVLRTAHFPTLGVPTLFIHGTRDPFGSEEEMREALKQIPAPSTLYMVKGAGHDLGKNHEGLATEIVAQAARFFA